MKSKLIRAWHWWRLGIAWDTLSSIQANSWLNHDSLMIWNEGYCRAVYNYRYHRQKLIDDGVYTTAISLIPTLR